MADEKISDLHLKIRNLERKDYPQVARLMDEVYPDIGGAWSQDSLLSLMNEFPEGQIAIEDNGKIVAVALTVMCSYERFSKSHTYDDLIKRRDLIRHDPEGDALYGMDVFVSEHYRDLRLGRRLYDARKELCRNLNLRAILLGGRIVRYHEHAEMDPQEYIRAVRRRKIHDPILSFQLSNDFEVKRLMQGYLPEDKKSLGYATLLEWNNILYEPEGIGVADIRKTVVRVGILQWQMRHTLSYEAWLSQVEFFVDSMSDYKADFVMFPEFFNAPLMGLGDQENQYEAIRFLATYADQIIDELTQFAVTYNINIIAGSIPQLSDGILYNNAYLCRRDGTVAVQPKIHITPHERNDFKPMPVE